MNIVEDLILQPAKTACFTGHRIIEDNISVSYIKKIIENLIERKYDTFLVGMALGFDTICFNILEEISLKNSINVIACVPCPEQANSFNEIQKREYDRMLNKADKVIFVCKHYSKKCMLLRNKFMVDNSSALISYVRKNKSGSKQTTDYARKKGIMVISI